MSFRAARSASSITGRRSIDEAVTELTKALAINPKSYIAHNYLGITASEKGWQEAAEKEMLEAINAESGIRRRALQSRRDLRDE